MADDRFAPKIPPDTTMAPPRAGGTDRADPTEGVLGRRLVAYAVDIVIIFGLTLIFGFAILVLGVITFGLAWVLFAILVPGVAILYGAATIGGPRQATIGMRLVGLMVVQASTGRRVEALTAGVHALLFYVAAGTFVLWLVDVVIGLVRPDRRLGHDLLVDVVVIRSAAS